mgnify:FL=1
MPNEPTASSAIDGADILDLGIPEGPLVGDALQAARACPAAEALLRVKQAWTDPNVVLNDPSLPEPLRSFARSVKNERERRAYLDSLTALDEPQPYTVFGEDLVDAQTRAQMDTAMRLPVARKGALMPDAHVGYGLPVGGVLACDNAVIPYAVGVDIACRMMVSVFPKPWRAVKGETERLANAIERETAFGAGSGFKQTPRQHDIMDDPRWDELPFVGRLRNKARHQLGSSGGGNHFVEWGTLTLHERVSTHYGALAPGEYVALMSHSGSRGFGFQVCRHYKDIAQERCYGLPDDMRHLAWLALDEQSGQDYWHSMQLAGDYASANHHLIHRHVAKAAKLKPVWQVENHHNFCFREEHDGQTLYVHRKGATPADEGQLGIIPGSMADRGVIVRGTGNDDALRSCSHGAGRQMSRTKAKQTLTRSDQKKYLAARGVTLLSGGLDESPMAYKSIDDVLDAQSDLVDVIAAFQPKIVKMADD